MTETDASPQSIPPLLAAAWAGYGDERPIVLAENISATVSTNTVYRVTLADNVCLSQRAFLCTGSHEFEKESFDLVTGPITIGESCWVGAASFVGPGVTFAPGSRSLAGTVVVKDVDAGTTVGGVPGRVLGA